MDKFKSFEEYVEITLSAQKRGLRNINCYLMPDEIKMLMQEDSLYYLNSDNVLQIIMKKDRYIKIYFYTNENFNFISFSSTLPIITDLPYSNKMPERLVVFREKLETQGFVLNSTTTRMSCTIFEESDIKIGDYVIEQLEEKDIDTIYDIWEENFDGVENLLYSKEEIKNNKNPVFLLKDRTGNVYGGAEILANGSYGWVQKIAIKKSQQGRGLGAILERFYINKCKSLGIKTLLLYTIDSNLNAQRFHKKFGFQPDGKYNCQFIYRS